MVKIKLINRDSIPETREVSKQNLFNALCKVYAYKYDAYDCGRVIVNWLPSIDQIEVIKVGEKMYSLDVTFNDKEHQSVAIEVSIGVLQCIMCARIDKIWESDTMCSSLLSQEPYLGLQHLDAVFDNPV